MAWLRYFDGHIYFGNGAPPELGGVDPDYIELHADFVTDDGVRTPPTPASFTLPKGLARHVAREGKGIDGYLYVDDLQGQGPAVKYFNEQTDEWVLGQVGPLNAIVRRLDNIRSARDARKG